jgi:acetyl esterase
VKKSIWPKFHGLWFGAKCRPTLPSFLLGTASGVSAVLAAAFLAAFLMTKSGFDRSRWPALLQILTIFGPNLLGVPSMVLCLFPMRRRLYFFGRPPCGKLQPDRGAHELNSETLSSLRMLITALLFSFLHPAVAQSQATSPQPVIRTYKTIGGTALKAHIFQPPDGASGKLRPAIIVLHGGGWNAGSPEWTYDDAQRFAAFGMVSIAGEYRLSNQKDITPLEAMADTRDLIRWVREHAAELAIDPHRVAVYGASAGGHLAASAAVFPHEDESKTSAIPDALLLLSPAVSIVDDQWPQRLLGTRVQVKTISPAENLIKRLPPLIIIEGAADTETPLARVQRFCDRAKQVGGTCELHVYPNVGHLLSRNLKPQAQEQGPFDPDPVASNDAHSAENAFLARNGYTK